MKKVKSGRIEEKSQVKRFLDKLHQYAYVETLIIVTLYLGAGYLINPQDICFLNSEVPYILILISIITLFHGFENGLISIGILSLAMWFFYPSFQYVDFLVILMMTLIFSEFHYYWTKKIKEAVLSADYRGAKLDELSRSFYTLKISHDQLEKNYVVKPMSIRNSIEKIVNMNSEVKDVSDIDIQNAEYYRNFLTMLEKSFNVNMGLVIYLNNNSNSKILDAQNVSVSYGANSKEHKIEDILEDYLIDRSLAKKQPIYISDEKGEPAVGRDGNSKFLAVIPSIINDAVVALLVIEKMPFMAFNRENLTSVSILLEYFSLEILEKNTLSVSDEISIVPDEKFRYEYARLKHLFIKYKVNSIILVLRLESELQSRKIFEKIEKMLRSLDKVTLVKENECYYITLLFPLHDESAALGYLNRLLGSIKDDRDKKFDYMTFDMTQTKMLNKYLREDYDG